MASMGTDENHGVSISKVRDEMRTKIGYGEGMPFRLPRPSPSEQMKNLIVSRQIQEQEALCVPRFFASNLPRDFLKRQVAK